MRQYMMERRADDNFRKKENEKLVQRKAKNPEQMKEIHASGVLDFLLDRTALWVGGLRKVGIELQLRHIELHRVT